MTKVKRNFFICDLHVRGSDFGTKNIQINMVFQPYKFFILKLALTAFLATLEEYSTLFTDSSQWVA